MGLAKRDRERGEKTRTWHKNNDSLSCLWHTLHLKRTHSQNSTHTPTQAYTKGREKVGYIFFPPFS